MLPIHLSWIKKSWCPLLLFIAYHSITSYKVRANMETIKQSCFLSVSSVPLSPGKVFLNFSAKNPYDKKMKLLMWYTPFEGFLSDLFIIRNSKTNQQLTYQGPMVKRLQPQPDDYLLISPNEVSSTTLNLSLAYHFKPGHYQLKLKSHTLHYEDKHLSDFPVICEAPSIEFSIK